MPIHNQLLYAGTAAPGAMPSPEALIVGGAFLTVDVSVPPTIATALTNAGKPVPASKTGLAVIDTGATLTCVHEPLLTGLDLHPVGMVTSGTAAGQIQQPLYVVRLVLPLIGWTLDLQVVGVNLDGQSVTTEPPQPIVALLGRNLLRSGVLIWNGVGGFWTLATLP